VKPDVFAAWVKAKGGTMPAAGKPSTATPAQPGAALETNTAEIANTTGPVENTTSAAPATNQAVAAGNAGQ
jgi:cytochrome c oxidase subunit 2